MTDRSSANFLLSSARQSLAGRIARRLTSSFLPLVSGLPGSPDGALVGLLARSLRSSVACPARRTDRSSTYFLVSSTRQWLARRFLGRIAHRLTSSFLPLVSGSPDGSLIGLLPRFSRSSVARWTERSSAYFLVSSARQWLAGRIARRLTSSSFRSSVACPARRTDRSSAYLLVSSARQWLAQLARRIAHRLTSSFLPLVSGLPGSPDGALIGLLPRYFRSSVARPTVPRTHRSSAYFLVSSARQWLARRSAHRLTSSFLPLVSGSPDGSLVGLFPLPSALQWLARLAEQSTHRLTSSFLPLVSGLPGSPDGSLIDLLPRSFRSSVA